MTSCWALTPIYMLIYIFFSFICFPPWNTVIVILLLAVNLKNTWMAENDDVALLFHVSLNSLGLIWWFFVLSNVNVYPYCSFVFFCTYIYIIYMFPPPLSYSSCYTLLSLPWQQIALLGPVPMHGVAKISSFYSSFFWFPFLLTILISWHVLFVSCTFREL